MNEYNNRESRATVICLLEFEFDNAICNGEASRFVLERYARNISREDFSSASNYKPDNKTERDAIASFTRLYNF